MPIHIFLINRLRTSPYLEKNICITCFFIKMILLSMPKSCWLSWLMLLFVFSLLWSCHLTLFNLEGSLPLPWPNRMKIALGAAKGLAFLHGGPKPVIYRDFKTSNVLLDAVLYLLNMFHIIQCLYNSAALLTVVILLYRSTMRNCLISV